MDLNVKLEVFEGPLDLLLHLLDKNKVSIYDIPIVEITNQYLEYITEMQRRDLNVMSEFMVMAATLLDIKARFLLPQENSSEDEEEADPREALVQQLLQYKMYKYISMELRDRQLDAGKLLYKDPTIPDEVKQYEEPVDLDELTKDYDLPALKSIFDEVMKRQANKVDPIRSKFGKIEKEEISVEDKITSLQKYIASHSSFSFRELLSAQSGKLEVIVTFLAILELMKVGTISAAQEETFGDIVIKVRDTQTV